MTGADNNPTLRRSLSNRRRSSSHDRVRRSSRHRDSVTSMDSSLSNLIDDNNHEMYSGAASEIIPSSISSLHYPHHFRDRKESSISRETSPLLQSERYSSTIDNELSLEPVKSNYSINSVETESHFRFFTADEIETAHGASTLQNPDDPIDYDTHWDYSVDKYGNEIELPEEAQYGSTSHSPDISFIERRNSTDSDKIPLMDSESIHSIDKFDQVQFNRQFPAKLYHQRFYIAEEDLVIGIAGYRNSWWKKMLFYLICISTLGIGYLVLRWLPRYRINLMGKKSPLGEADWVVIENEFGELAIVNIKREWFNDKLSSFLIAQKSAQTGANDLTDSAISLAAFETHKDPIVPFLVSFHYRYIKFFYSPLEDMFKTNENWYDSNWLHMSTIKNGLSQDSHKQRLSIFDENRIEITEKTIGQLLVDEVLHPFYIFQIGSIILWSMDEYYYYATCIFIISMVSIINTLVETKITIKRLQEISKFTCEIRVWRNEFWKQIDSNELVPGDVYEVDPSLSIIPCDSILVNGECVINESMLTGESVPVSKVSASSETVKELKEDFASPVLSKSFLYNGTKLLKMKSNNDEPVIALVVKTGFSTTKGSLIRSMLFPKPTGFKFYEDSFKYIGFMSIIATIGFVYSTYNFIQLGLSKRIMILRALDIITIVVPPALPATLTIGTTFAINRLKLKQIYCIAPTRVNIGGKVDVMCFDKTGTLTEDGLDVLGIHLSTNAKGRKEIVFEDLVEEVGSLSIEKKHQRDSNNGMNLLIGMSTCHSLRLIDDELLGDPLDSKMFEFTKWRFEEDVDIGGGNLSAIVYADQQIHGFITLKEYEFISHLRRMSVIVRNYQSNKKVIYTKGAPEVMYDICLKESIPTNYDDLLHHYTHNGYRVIALACKEVNQEPKSRDEAESNMTFLGFIVFENKLKDSTAGTLKTLNEAAIRTIMCTGDNILTAISVGKECGLVNRDHKIFFPTFAENNNLTNLVWEEVNDSEIMLDPITLKPLDIRTDEYRLAITGDIFRYILTELKDVNITHNILMKCDIFARMSPDEKHELVSQLQKIDYTVGFCGDGANDCGALKAADVGISLSEAEASVAAPFTSRIFEISCVLDVIREGRSSLVTSFSCFKYMSLYSAIQFVTVTILYKRGSNLGDFQFLYIDLFLILPIAIFMSWSQPFEKIVIKRPTANLVSPKILIPLVCHIVVILLFQAALWLYVQELPWYIKPIPAGDDAVQSSDNTVLFFFSNFQYILIAIVLNTGPPYREPMTKNIPFIFNVAVACLISFLLMLANPDSSFGDLMQLTKISSGFKLLIVVTALINLAVMLIGEETLFLKLARIYKRYFQKPGSKKLFKNLKKEFVVQV